MTDASLAALEALDVAEASVTASIVELVRIARERGHTWQEIAGALGVSKQAAWERFSYLDGSSKE